MVEGPHGFVNVVCELDSSINAPLASSRKNVTAPVAFPFAIVSTKSHGCGVCAVARKIPGKQASAATSKYAITRRRNLSSEGHRNIPNFLALNAWLSLLKR
jgi:hypothetical protein